MAAAPNVWTEQQLAADAAHSQGLVVQRILGATHYEAAFAEAMTLVEALMVATNDLRSLAANVLVSEPALTYALRFCAGPPVSNDIIVGQVGGSISVKALPIARAQKIVALLTPALDPHRFNWLAASRAPLKHERELAIQWTAGLIAVERARTRMRMEPSQAQEVAIKGALEAAGLKYVKRDKLPINLISDLEPGTYTDETMCGTRQADVPARLFDGRLLLIEAKVSGTQLNSLKRLVNDSAAKAPVWRNHFGAGAAVPVAVLSGAFALEHLKMAQGATYGLYIVWDHRLQDLTSFAKAAV